MTKKMTSKFVLQNIYKRFGDKSVLEGVDLNVFTGESLVII